jgi:hypothetical protein
MDLVRRISEHYVCKHGEAMQFHSSTPAEAASTQLRLVAAAYSKCDLNRNAAAFQSNDDSHRWVGRPWRSFLFLLKNVIWYMFRHIKIIQDNMISATHRNEPPRLIISSNKLDETHRHFFFVFLLLTRTRVHPLLIFKHQPNSFPEAPNSSSKPAPW